MPSSASLAGLMKFVASDPWCDAFDEVMDRHFGPGMKRADVADFDALRDLIDEHWVTTLWGCAFEDFLTQDIDGAGNVVDIYLQRRGWREKVVNKAYMAALRSSTMSLYEVSDIKPGKSFMARDLLRGGDPIQVSEHSGTKTMKPWSRIAMRVVKVRGKTGIGGGALPFDHDLSEEMISAFANMKKNVANAGPALFEKLGLDTKAPEIGDLITSATSDTELLQRAAPLFSTLFLVNLVDRLLNPELPQLFNSDGDEMAFIGLFYRLQDGVGPEEIQAVLDQAPELEPASSTFWNWLAPEQTAPSKAASAKGKALIMTSTMDDGSTVLGTIELKTDVLEFRVNSESRAERGRVMMEALLDGLVGAPLVERQTVERALAERRETGETTSKPLDLSPEEQRQIMDDHYRRQLDKPIPALGDLSPRQAAESEKGREKLVTWLKRLENQGAKANHNDPMKAYDVSWIWKELDIFHLRR
jgi:hypothetical protein